jgi:hypothetical protein
MVIIAGAQASWGSICKNKWHHWQNCIQIKFMRQERNSFKKD